MGLVGAEGEEREKKGKKEREKVREVVVVRGSKRESPFSLFLLEFRELRVSGRGLDPDLVVLETGGDKGG